MGELLFSTYWYRVAGLKPVLGASAVVSRHLYRGQIWYVLRNHLNGRVHRFNGAAYSLIGRMDGRQTVAQIWDDAGKSSAEAVPTQDEVILLLGRLYDAGLIQSDILPSVVELFRQAQGRPSNSWKQRFSNPFSLRIPLCDPDRFLERWGFLSAPLFTRGALLLWTLIVLAAMVAAVMHWPELSSRVADQLFLPGNLLLFWLTYPLVKICHEFGHGLAVKRWGGEVHELGVMLLALTPVPYVDATASAFFPEKGRRIAAAALGMMVELLLASLALFVWLTVETGLVSTLAYNVMLIGGVSTLLFNGNPLLRYDGYYMLADWIEIPNLGQRANRYLGYLLQRYLLGIDTAESPVTAPGEKGWFMVYGPVSFGYRMAVLVGLVWLVSGRFFIVGVLIALWGAVSLLMVPAFRALSRFLENPAVQRRRFRLMAVGGGAALGLLLLVFVFPMPLWTTAQGVVWLSENAVIRAGTDGEVLEVLASVEQMVDRGMPLLRESDPFLEAQLDISRARLEELYAVYQSLAPHERVERKMQREEIERIKADLSQTEEKREKLLVRSPARGKFILINDRNIVGRFVRQGERLGYIVARHRPTIRVVVRQADIGLIRERVTGVAVRLAEQADMPLKAGIVRIVPAADLNLPSAALGTAGGGLIPVDPSDPAGLRALENLFQLDIGLPEQVKEPHIGGRVYVRFEHGRMSLAMQWYRSLRQLFLGEFYV
ncbi:MAG: HlyD family efflux transporter periplasmic adaptor subunit [Desulfobacterales bacterium]|nr:HlyD family efflux transporter periplasmic adaptor subunit [Desulfobacterales bacterium]